MVKTEFGIKVRMELFKRDMTLKQLSQELGISIPYLSDILRGQRKGKKQRKRIIEILELEEEVDN